MIQGERLERLNRREIRRGGHYVLYWMQASQRTEYNHALEYAIGEANGLGLPVVVYFQVIDHFPNAVERHYAFMLEGLREIRDRLEQMNIRFLLSYTPSPPGGTFSSPVFSSLADRAALVVTDCGYTQFQREWRRCRAEKIDCLMVQVESDVVVPVTAASPKEEYSAATFRKKITTRFADFLVPLHGGEPRRSSLSMDFSTDFSTDFLTPDFFTCPPESPDFDGLLDRLRIDRGVAPSPFYRGGPGEAQKKLDIFLREHLADFHRLRNDPARDRQSQLGPYFHFGHLSPLHAALRAMEHDGPGTDAFLEQLIVRRELAINFVYRNPHYMSFDGLPRWAADTLRKHQKDPRPYLYSADELEKGETHDPYWNAAQREMRLTGKMHGYMRMYWGKKILEWTPDPQRAMELALYLNDRYHLDGRDPNGFAGVAWCFGKHDRPWKERPVFGYVRYMNDRGLERKFDINAYVGRIKQLEGSNARDPGIVQETGET